jgi:isoaspartyl peptidase/L-asparaginase-like protein (Ntn-hydrolase superfamily)
LNADGDIEMDASIMDGRDLSAGAVSAVRCIANPTKLARLVMEKVCVTKVLLSWGVVVPAVLEW